MMIFSILQVLHELLDFVGLPNAPRFKEQAVKRISAFKGTYREVSDEDVSAQEMVARFHASQSRDLRALLAKFFPNVDLEGFS